MPSNIASIVRWFLGVVVGLLVSHGVITADQTTTILSNLFAVITGVASVGWIIYKNRHATATIVAAVDTQSIPPSPAAVAAVKADGNLSVPLSAILLSLVLTGAMLSACKTTPPSQTVTAACLSNAAAISVLSDLRSAGKLTPAVIVKVNNDIAITDPVCSDPSGQSVQTAVQSAAFAELLQLAGIN